MSRKCATPLDNMKMKKMKMHGREEGKTPMRSVKQHEPARGAGNTRSRKTP